MTGGGENDQAPLVPLREDLRLLPGPTRPDGAPTWLVYDPVQHRYFQIDQHTRAILDLWPGASTASDLAEAAIQKLAIGKDDVENLIAFVMRHNLTLQPQSGGASALWDQKQRGRHGIIASLLHNYLFFRIPLVRPDRFLRTTLPLVEPLFSRVAAVLVALCGIIGLYLVSRQWDIFISAAGDFLSWEGLVWFSAALFFVKALHELGHAYTAVRYGCAVPAMGVAVMLLAPMLYTDVTDAWRLTSRRKRVAVASAGIIVELGLACLATLSWALLADGPLRSIALVVATTSWLLSVAMNLNPLMRFDGYYILADALGLENLLDRSFALGRWKMREVLFGLGDPQPEQVSDRHRRLMIGYAWAVWLYRLILFTGIALLVYHLFFKVLGIILFLVEIIYFILWPVWSECAEWLKRRQQIVASQRSLISMAVATALLLAFFVPWSARVEVPAVLEYETLNRIYPVRPAQVVEVHATQGAKVAKGDKLVELMSHEIESEIRHTKINLSLVETRRARFTADTVDREQALVLDRQFRSLKSKLLGLEAERQQLTVRASMAGVVLAIDPSLAPGRIVARRDAMALVGEPTALAARGFIAELDVSRIEAGTQGRFIPDDLTHPSFGVVVTDIGASGVSVIDIEALTSVHGGPIAVANKRDRGLVPTAGYYPIRLSAEARHVPVLRSLKGLVVLDGTRESMAGRTWRRAAGILVRERGF